MESTWPVSNKKFDEHVNDTTKHISISEVKTICIGFPDYTNKSQIVEDGGTLNWTATGDGWLQIALRYRSDAYGTLLVATDIKGSNVTAIGGTGGQDYDMDVQMIPCKKGHVYKYVSGTVDEVNWSSNLASGIKSVYYIPFL